MSKCGHDIHRHLIDVCPDYFPEPSDEDKRRSVEFLNAAFADTPARVCCEDCGGTDDEYLLVGTVLFCRREACKRAAHDEHASLMRRVTATDAALLAAAPASTEAGDTRPHELTPSGNAYPRHAPWCWCKP